MRQFHFENGRHRARPVGLVVGELIVPTVGQPADHRHCCGVAVETVPYVGDEIGGRQAQLVGAVHLPGRFEDGHGARDVAIGQLLGIEPSEMHGPSESPLRGRRTRITRSSATAGNAT